MQKIIIAGRLGADPEVRHTPSGQKVTSFRVAANTRVKGEDITTWYRVSVWGDRYDGMMTYLKKGSSLIAMGDFRANTYVDRDGKTQIGLEVTADSIQFTPSSGQQSAERSEGGGGQKQSAYAGSPTGEASRVTEDDLPF